MNRTTLPQATRPGCGPRGLSFRRARAWGAAALLGLASACDGSGPGMAPREVEAVGGASGSSAMPPPLLDPGRKEPHRLSSNEYNATVQDVLGTKLQPAGANWRGGELGGFDNMASVLSVDEAQYERYFETAQSLATDTMATDEQRARFMPCALKDPACVRSSIAAAGLRLFRRPLDEQDLAGYERVYQAARSLGDNEQTAFTLSLRALLSSAPFVYRIEFDEQPDSRSAHPLSGFELLSRLSYFLWNSAPDDDLLRAAGEGGLSDPSKLTSVVDRMLDDPKSQRFVASFVGQWLGARQVMSHPTLSRFYQWTPSVARAASDEMFAYFADFLRTERSWLEFPLADFNYANRALAQFYGIPNDLGDSAPPARFEFLADQRAGFFGLAGFLAVSSFDRRTSPSKRGHWIARTLLCADPPPAPPNVPELDSRAEDTSKLNVRERLERHRAQPPCAGCHALFDPYGLALEEYDSIGLYRSNYEDGTAVDATATLPASAAHPDGLGIRGLDGLARAVADDPRFTRCLALKLLTYGLGRVVKASDEPFLQAAQEEWLAPGQTASIRRLIQALVTTEAFRFRRGGAP